MREGIAACVAVMYLGGMEKMMRSVEEMNTFAREVAANLSSSDVLLLEGDLGAGKTTFVQGLAKALGIAGPVTSPSFTVVGEYEISGQDELKKLVHVDLYRLEGKTAEDPSVLDVLEKMGEEGRVTVIEWANYLDSEIEGAKRVRFAHGESEDERAVSFGE